MIRHSFFKALLTLFVVLAQLYLYVPVEAGTIKEIKVAKHIVKGSGVTKDQMENWMKQANEAFKTSFKFVQVSAPDEVENVGEGKVDGAINIYGSDLTATAPGNPGYAMDQNYINVGKPAPDSTMAHELGHWLGAVPDTTTSEHGTEMGGYPGFPGYKGSDTNGDGKVDDEDRKNLMFPGTARTGIVIDDKQQETAHKKADEWLKSVKAKATGKGKDESDPIGDTPYSYADITYDSVWGDGINKDNYEMHFSILTQGLAFDAAQSSILGFMIESDQSLVTGVPGTGIDYFLGYSPVTDTVIFEHYDTAWLPLDTSEIIKELAYLSFDGPFDPIAIGVNLALPYNLFTRQSDGNLFSFYAQAEANGVIDRSPDSGIKTISVPEPGSITLMVGGFWLLSCFRKMRKGRSVR